jgi:iron complex transport system ATP-binding protein
MTADLPALVEGLSFAFGRRTVLHNIDLSLGRGEIVALVGPNGCGKSTLLRCMLGMLRPWTGHIRLSGQDIRTLPARQRARLVAYVPQASPPAFPMSVFDICLLGRSPHLRAGATRSDHAIVETTLRRLSLEDFAFRLVSELSGGERQRVMLARALIQETGLLVLDEPTSALDLRNQLQTMRLVAELTRERNVTALVAIHDLSLAARFADRVILLQAGRVAGSGDWRSTLTARAIREVYGVDVDIATQNGVPVFVPHELTENGRPTTDNRPA